MRELQVTITNLLKYQDKKTNADKVRIGYINQVKGSLMNTDRQKGYPELSVYVNYSDNLWKGIDVKDIFQPAIFVFEETPSAYDPMRIMNVLKEIKIGDKTISVL